MMNNWLITKSAGDETSFTVVPIPAMLGIGLSYESATRYALQLSDQAQTIAAQAAEIERLRSELQEKNKFVSDAISACSKSGLEIGRLREALEFYANPDTYRQLMEKEPYGETWIDTPKGSPLDIQDMDDLGAGVIAREALQPQEAENETHA
jgi:hypothetical protein